MNFTIKFPPLQEDPTPTVQFVDFPKKTWELFHDFMDFSDEAHRTRFSKELSTYNPSFHIPKSGLISNVGVVPDDEAFYTFLHKYRPIVLENERTSFPNICTALIRHINDPIFTQVIKEWKKQYSGAALRDIFTMKQGNIVLIGEKFLLRYLNAFEYHRDTEKRESLLVLSKTFEPDAVRGLVTLLLQLKFCAVSNLRCLIREVEQLKMLQEAKPI